MSGVCRENKKQKTRKSLFLLAFTGQSSREEGIRTLDTVTHILAFQASSFNHADTSLIGIANNIKKNELEKEKVIIIPFLLVLHFRRYF